MTVAVAGNRETVRNQEVLTALNDNSGPTFDTKPLEKVDSDIILDSSDMYTNEREVDQHAEELGDERFLLASLIANLKLDQKKDFKERVDKDMDKIITLENQVKFLNDVVYKTGNPKYLKKAQWEKSCLYNVQYDKNDLANIFAPENEETIRLAEESRSKMVDDLLLQEFFSKDFLCVILLSIDDIDEYSEIACKYLEKVEECERIEIDLSKSHKQHDKSFAQLEKHCINLELALQNEKEKNGNNLLTGTRGSDLYAIALQESSSPTLICFMAKDSSTQAWLWHHLLSHLNSDTINLVSKNDIVNGLPKLKYVNDQLCSSCEMGKANRSNFKTKTTPSSKGGLHLLYTDLCGPMRVQSINGKKYIIVIVDDYSRYTWTHFLRSKDETPKVLINFLKMIQRGLQAQVITVRADRGTEFLNKTLETYFKE
ncbi:retrovirus-related pol polyprotein from transposon TNT 1-94 [Tanacetum coccineum]|uniref:Retrovirus-related pol polyprotein from transposon TNT 1-94 n=1 Tax=Tanacetum coccineum TaxID=301880 RepID=A0ABQ5FS14_9ASTR